jgi:DNA-binding response OmpR family regulator
MKSNQIDILLVEDNPGDARLVREMLQDAHRLRHEVAHVKTISQAREYLLGTVPHVVLLDLTLPDGQGLKSASQLIEAFPAVPFIILTGLDDETIGLESVRRGAQDYLVKGHIDGKLIVRVILYAIERKQSALEREKLIRDLQDLISQVKTLRGLLPMCAWCKKIRDDKGEWVVLESYLSQHSNTDITHGICPECAQGLSKPKQQT